MKKITLIMLVAMVPFLSIAQKRSKKVDSQKKVERIFSQYDFMVIKGQTIRSAGSLYSSADTPAEVKLKITFDTGGIRMIDSEDLSKMDYKSMAHAVNSAGRLGWEFINANVLIEQGKPVHYYYMRKQRR